VGGRAEITGLLFVLGLTGCGYSNPDLYRSELLSPPSMTNDSKLVMTCDFQGIGRISSEVKLDCESVERNFWLGSEILGSRSILSTDEYARIYNNYEILILDHNCVDPACNYLALYHAGSHPWSEMEPSMIPMLHEQLHHLDTLRGEKTANHENWDVKGFWAADKEFQQRMTPVTEKVAQ